MTASTRPVRITGSRWDVIARLITRGSASVLDVGCRGRELERHLPEAVRYVGVDICAPADVIASAENAFPFADDTFDDVVLADVLEHLERPHAALDEAIRVSSRGVIVLLPNVLTLINRLRFALGRVPGKYELLGDPTSDRHRWLMNYEQAARFTARRAQLAGWCVSEEYAYEYPFRRTSVRVAHMLLARFTGPNIWAWEYVARLEPSAADGSDRS